MNKTINIAIVGCGFVADYYMATLHAYSHLNIIGVFDKDPNRLSVFTSHYQLRAYDSFEELIGDKKVKLVLNLTDPRSHYSISKQCLKANKHVYSEKPLAMNYEDAEELSQIAKENNLQIISVPCSVLGKSAKPYPML